jgi:RHS repeat-associated protein
MAFAAGILFGAQAAQAGDNPPPLMSVPGEQSVTATGGFTYTIPIAVPPGTAQMVPALSLDYSSTNGNGDVGFGWVLAGLPSITRCPTTLAQDGVHGAVNYDTRDRFCFNSQRLILISGTYGANNSEYRTEIETFTRVIAHGTAGNGPQWFEVHTKTGQTLQLGNSTDSRPLAVGTTTVRAWTVNRITDTKGNYLTVTYTNDQTNGQTYPSRVDYTGNTAAGLATYNSVQFMYNTSRPDVTPTYQAGSLMKTTVLLTHIKTFAGANLVTDYQLGYRLGSSTTHSRLTSVTQCDASAVCLAPTTFGWQGGTGSVSWTVTPNSLAQGQYPSFGDFNGDGLTDLIAPQAYRFGGPPCPSAYSPINYGTPSGSFNGISPSAPIFTSINDSTGTRTTGPFCPSTSTIYSGPGTVGPPTGDFNGDGFEDVNFSLGTAAGFDNHSNATVPVGILMGDFLGDGKTQVGGPMGGASHVSIYEMNSSYTFVLARTYAYNFGAADDFDGDGCLDGYFFNSSNKLEIAMSCDSTNPTYTITALSSASGNQFIWGDFNGDGKTDVIYGGNLYLSTGRTYVLAASGVIPSSVFGVTVGDFNGDGKQDISYADPTTGYIDVFLSTGTGFVSQGTVTGIDPEYPPSPGWDINSDGASDIWAWSGTFGSQSEVIMSYTPELLNSVSNGLGSTTTITYDRLNENGSFYTKGTSATYPTQDVDGPIYVVSRVDASNGLGTCTPPSTANCYSNAYSYAGAQKDLHGRGFLGFGSVINTDLETGIVETTNYRTDFPFVGQVSSQTKVCPTPVCSPATTLYSITNSLESVTLGSGTTSRYFVAPHQIVTAQNDLDGTAMPGSTIVYTYDCDSVPNPCYGNAVTVAQTWTDGSSKTTTNTWSNDATNWFLSRLLTANVQSIVGTSNLTRHSSYAYDPASGLRTQEILEPSATDNTYLKTLYGLDAFGNKTSVTLSSYTNAFGAARQTLIGYDTKGQFATSTTNALSQSDATAFTSAASLGFDVPTSHTDLNSLTTNWGYDTFGRRTLETRPDGNKTVIAYAYCSGVNGGSASCPTYGAYFVTITPENSSGVQNGPISYVYYDTLSRIIAKDVEGFNGSIVRVATQYDALGRVGQTSRPYFVSGGTPKWTVNTYDILARATVETFPDSSHTTFAFHGLTTSDTNDLGQTRTTLKNAQGLVAQVTDALSQNISYVYDAFGDLATVTDPSGNVTSDTYDIRGRKTASNDPDLGNWTYGYNAFAELTGQVDAKSQSTTIAYDLLGRMTQRVEPGLTSNWVYDTATKGVGQLASACIGSGCTNPTNSTYFRAHSYDSLGRPSSVALTIGGTAFTYTDTYNSDGLLDTVTYPSGTVLKEIYTATQNYLSQVKDNASGTIYWTANTRDAEMHLTQTTAGNGVVIAQMFDPNTGLLQQTEAGTSGSPSSIGTWNYTFDTIGNLTSRADSAESFTENFCYDGLNRLQYYAFGSSCTSSGSKTVGYDALGNITSKSNVGTYSYPTPGTAQPHAVSSITGTVNGVVNPTYTYDANGNMTAGAGRTASYTAFNMASLITQGSTTDAFTYNPEHERITSALTGTGTTSYLNALGDMSEQVVSTSGTTWHDFIQADGQIVAEKFSGATNAMAYFALDHLDSIILATDASGAVSERDSYDAWGRRRNPDGSDSPNCTVTSASTRGFTNQEMIDALCAVNLNARIYDPTIGRFMSADSTVTDFSNLQDWNGYTYVNNGPLSFRDPEGHSPYPSGNGCCSTLMSDIQKFLADNPGGSFVLGDAGAREFAQEQQSAKEIAHQMSMVGASEPAPGGTPILQQDGSSGPIAGQSNGPAAFSNTPSGNQIGGQVNSGAPQDANDANASTTQARNAVGGQGGVAAGQTIIGIAEDMNGNPINQPGPTVIEGSPATDTNNVQANVGVLPLIFPVIRIAPELFRFSPVAIIGSGLFFSTSAGENCEANPSGLGCAGHVLQNSANRPPPGSKPIDQTPWSGDHRAIKRGVGAGAADNVKIAPNGDVWVENPDGSWDNAGHARNFTGSETPSGQRGKDRE